MVVDGKVKASRLHERQEFEELELPPMASASTHFTAYLGVFNLLGT
jgi:hypothetical protein